MSGDDELQGHDDDFPPFDRDRKVGNGLTQHKWWTDDTEICIGNASGTQVGR